MPLAYIYWILMLLWLVLGIASSWPSDGKLSWRMATPLIPFLLFLILGWAEFGDAIQQ